MPTTFCPATSSETPLAETQVSANPRIASLLPGLTDVLNDLNLRQYIVANSHECDHNALSVTHSKLPSSQTLPSAEIAAGWHAATATHPLTFSPSFENILSTRLCSFYHVNVPALVQAKPTLILTHLSKPNYPDQFDEDALRKLAKAFIPSLQVILSVNCQTLNDIFLLHREVAYASGYPRIAIHSVASARGRLESVRSHADAFFRQTKRERPRVAIVQWADPLYLAGDWIPRVVAIAGGRGDGVTREGKPSVAGFVRNLRDADVIVFAICAMSIKGCQRIAENFWKRAVYELRGWGGRIVITDATRLFSRMAVGSVVQSAEVIAEILSEKPLYGHKGVLWQDWKIPFAVKNNSARI